MIKAINSRNQSLLKGLQGGFLHWGNPNITDLELSFAKNVLRCFFVSITYTGMKSICGESLIPFQ